MPLYEYACDKKHVTAVQAKISEMKKTIKCEECGETAKKLVSAGTHFTLKGHNWAAKGGY